MTCETCSQEKLPGEMKNWVDARSGVRKYGRQCNDCRSTARRADTAAKAAAAARKRERYAEDGDYRSRIKEQYRKWRYGLTGDEYDRIWLAQGSKCAVCGEGEATSVRGWHVDHDHACCPDPARSCGKCVRGILCHGCNVALGNFKDDPRIIEAALDYLKRSIPA